MKKPLVLHSDGYYTPTAYFDKNAEAVYKQYLNGDYDGIIIENSDKSVDDSVIYLLDNPTQIKSATDNIGTFDKGNPDIRYSLSEKPEGSDTDGKSEEGAPRRGKTPISEKTRTEIENKSKKIRNQYEEQIKEEIERVCKRFDAEDGKTLQEIQEERFGRSMSERIAEENARYRDKKKSLKDGKNLSKTSQEWHLSELEQEHQEHLSRIQEEQGPLDDAIKRVEELRGMMNAEIREVRAPITDGDPSRVLTEAELKEQRLSEQIAEENVRYRDEKKALKESKNLSHSAQKWHLSELEQEHQEHLFRIQEEQGPLVKRSKGVSHALPSCSCIRDMAIHFCFKDISLYTVSILLCFQIVAEEGVADRKAENFLDSVKRRLVFAASVAFKKPPGSYLLNEITSESKKITPKGG